MWGGGVETQRTVVLFIFFGSLGMNSSMCVFHSCDWHVYLFPTLLFSCNIISHSGSHLHSVHSLHL